MGFSVCTCVKCHFMHLKPINRTVEAMHMSSAKGGTARQTYAALRLGHYWLGCTAQSFPLDASAADKQMAIAQGAALNVFSLRTDLQ